MMRQPSNRADERKSVSQDHAGDGPEAACAGTNDPAGELFRIASLLTGDQGQAVELLEDVLAGVSTDPCADPAAFRNQTNARLINLSVRRISEKDPGAFQSPISASGPGDDEPCIDTDDLSAAGISRDEFVDLIESKQVGVGKTREWMERLPAALRVVFVLRAILGMNFDVIASELRDAAGAHGSGWTETAVRTAYRRALCLLASALVTAPPVAVANS